VKVAESTAEGIGPKPKPTFVSCDTVEARLVRRRPIGGRHATSGRTPGPALAMIEATEKESAQLRSQVDEELAERRSAVELRRVLRERGSGGRPAEDRALEVEEARRKAEAQEAERATSRRSSRPSRAAG
jgi:hypothetical protein